MTPSITSPGGSEPRSARRPGEAAQPQTAEAELRLPRPPGVFRRWLAAHPRLVDGFIVGAYLVGCVLAVAVDVIAGSASVALPDLDQAVAAETGARPGYLGWPWITVVVLVVAVVALALAYRRRYPLLGVVAVSLSMLFELGFIAGPNSVALVFLLYAAPVYRGVAAGWAAFGIALVSSTGLFLATGAAGSGLVGPAGVIASGPLNWREALVVSAMNGLWLLTVVVIGINMGNRRRYVAALIDRAHQLAREREQQAQLAASAERARIAREMHDVVAHSLSVVVTLAEAAAATVETRPEQAKQATERAAETGRAALVEMRRLLGVLRDDVGEGEGERHAKAPLAPQPGLAQLPELVRGFREAGLGVRFAEEGEPAGDGGQQLAVYRIVQEALTNALRYAGSGASAAVLVRHDPRGTRVEVTDEGPVAGSRRGDPIEGSGLGLAGAAQRAEMFGGGLEAGPHGRGWRVIADIPSEPGAVAPVAARARKTEEGA